MTDRTPGASGLQRPSSRIGKPLQSKLAAGVAASVLNNNQTTLSNQAGASAQNRLAERRTSSSSASSGVATPVNATPLKKVPDVSGGSSTASSTRTGPAGATGGGDELCVGDTVSIPGGKLGKLLFLGETHFAKGEWAGVYLDEAAGKNDGSLDGKIYFTCPDKHGIFIKPAKLTKVSSKPLEQKVPETPNTSKMSSTAKSTIANKAPAQTSEGLNAATRKVSSSLETPASKKLSTTLNTPSMEVTNARVASGNNAAVSTPLRSMTPAGVQSNNFGAVQLRVKPGIQEEALNPEDLAPGEKIWVNGVKPGTVAFVGETQFAPGVWVGIILGDKSGKNDGSVNGTRYFNCEHGYGLFSPIAKITKEQRRPPSAFPQTSTQQQQQNTTLRVSATPTPQRPASAAVDPRLRPQQEQLAKRRGSATGQLQRDKLGGSTSSVNSIGSTASARGMIPPIASSNNSVQQLQMALREAEVRENQLRVLVDQSDKNKLELDKLLEEEKRKVDDLHFRMEEESIRRGDLMNERNMLKHQLEALEANLTETQDSLEEMRKKYLDLEFQMTEQSMEDSDSGVSVNSHNAAAISLANGQICELEESIRQKDLQIHNMKSDFETQKTENLKALRQVEELNGTVANLTEENERYLFELEEMKMNLYSKQTECNELEFKFNEMKISNSSLEEQLKVQNNASEVLKQEKHSLETTIENLTNSSGDSDSQISILTKEVKSHQATIEQLKLEVQSLNEEKLQQKTLAGTLKNQHEEKLRDSNQEHAHNIAEKDSKISALEGKINELNTNLQSYRQQLESYISSCEQLKEALRAEKSAKEAIHAENSTLNNEVLKLRDEVDNVTDQLSLAKAEVEMLSQQNKNYVDQTEQLRKENSNFSNSSQQALILQREIEELKIELENSRRVLSERDSQIAKLDNSMKESTSYETELCSVREQYETVLEKFMTIQSEVEQKNSILAHKEHEVRTLQDENDDYKSRIQALIDDYTSLEADLLQEREQNKVIDTLTEQISRLKRNLNELNEKVATKEQTVLQYKEANSKYKAELDVALKKAESARSYTSSGDVNMQIKTERDSLQKQVDFLNSVIVELNNKNELLTQRYEALAFMESGAKALDTLEDFDDDSPVKGMNHNIRLFCDICDEFDLHNTEDCPVQASRPESPPASRNRGNITEERPYCDVCDCFDHWTEDCDDDQMF